MYQFTCDIAHMLLKAYPVCMYWMIPALHLSTLVLRQKVVFEVPGYGVEYIGTYRILQKHHLCTVRVYIDLQNIGVGVL